MLKTVSNAFDTPRKKILVAFTYAIAVAIFFGFFFQIPPANAGAKFSIFVRMVKKGENPPCGVVAGIKRGAKIKTTDKYISYSSSKAHATITYYPKKNKCALIQPRRG